MKRLLISGSEINKNTLGHFYAQNFNEQEIQYEILKFHDAYLEFLNSSIRGRLLNRFFPTFLVQKMDRLLLEQVDKFKPDIILIFKGMEISKNALKKIKKRNRKIQLVNYNLDHPFEFFSKGSGNRFVKAAIPYYDLHITYSKHIQKQLTQKYQVNTAWLPFGFQLSEDDYKHLLTEDLPEIPRACFIGNPDKWRIELIDHLLAHKIPIDLYGIGWDKVDFSNKEDSLLKIVGPYQSNTFWNHPLDFWKVVRKYRLQLNFFRPHNIHSHNLRTFEIPAGGGILLTPASEEQDIFFVENEECFFYESPEELIKKCHIIFGLSPTEALRVRKKARQRSVDGGYCFKNRTRQLLKILSDL